MSSAGEALLVLDGMGKAFSGVQVLEGVSLTLLAGEVVGLVGENGSGKSTTMNIMAGILAPDEGSMRLDGSAYAPRDRRESERAGIAFIQQELNVFPTLSVAENLLLGRVPQLAGAVPLTSRRQIRRAAAPWLEKVGLEVPPDRLASALSSGQRQLLEIARALASDARVMIFDEPTTSLTAREAQRLFELIDTLRAQGLAIVFISHALEDVLALADQVIVLRDGSVVLASPRNELTVPDLVSAMIGRTVETLFPERPGTYEESPREVLLKANGLGVDGAIEGVDLDLHVGEIVGIAGLMGSGRTELARALFGLDAHQRGTIEVGTRAMPSGAIAARLDAGMAFLTEDRRHEGMLLEASVADNVALAALPAYRRGRLGRLDRARLRRDIEYQIRSIKLKSGPAERTQARLLSGGNQQKVLLSRWMLRQPRVFVLDEPTRGVDVGAKQDIYHLLAEMAEAGAGLIVISSELEEVMGLADRILVMYRGRPAGWFARSEFDRSALLAAAFGQERAA